MNFSPYLVVGGGFAGAAAAIRLAQAGKSVTLVETRATPGGRVYSIEDRETGEAIDNGQHLLMGCYDRALETLDALGTKPLLRAQDSLRVDFADCSALSGAATIHTLDTSALPGKAGVLAGLAKLGGLPLRDKISAVRLSLAFALNRVRAERKTALEILREYNQSDNLIRRFWEPIILATLNAEPSVAAASLLVAVFRKAFLGGTEASKLLLPSVELSETLAPLPAWLERNGGCFRQATATDFIVENNRVTGVRLSDGGTLRAERVISAVPPRALRKLIPEDVHPNFFAPLSKFEFSPIISVYMWFDRSFIETDFIAMLGTQTQWVFNRRAFCRSSPEAVRRFPGHVSVTVSAGDGLIGQNNDAIAALCWEEIRRAFPAARAATLLRVRVIKEKMATLKITPEAEQIRLPAITPLDNLFLAGDWTSTGLPATIEGAAQSGRWAAQQALLEETTPSALETAQNSAQRTIISKRSIRTNP